MNWLKSLLLKIAGFAKVVVEWLLSPQGRDVLDWATKLLPIVIASIEAASDWRGAALYHAKRELTRSKEQVPPQWNLHQVRKAAVTANLPAEFVTDDVLRAAIEIAGQMAAAQKPTTS